MFVRLGKLADKLVGKTARGKRQFVRWPKEMASFKKDSIKNDAGVVTFFAGVLLSLTSLVPPILGGILSARPSSSGLLISGLLSITAILLGTLLICIGCSMMVLDRLFCKISVFMESLLGKDPHLTLGAAAFFTVGAMPEWLRAQLSKESGSARRPAWLETRLAEEPYTVERAGLDYLELVSRIDLVDGTPDGSFHGKPFPSVYYRLPGSLKTVVGEIVLFLSSLPDSGEAPGEDAVEAVMDTINSLATIDGESFTEAVRRLHEEAENEKKEEEDKARAEKKAAEDKARADYDGEVMKAVDTTRNTLTAKTDAETDERRKRILRGMDRLSKISKECEHAAVSADIQRVEAISITRSITR